MPENNDPKKFHHLRLLHRDTQPAKYPPAPGHDPKVEANKADRQGHAGKLRDSFNRFGQGSSKRAAVREKEGLPPITSGTPFMIEVAAGFDIDVLVSAMDLDVVSEEFVEGESQTRYLLVATEDITDSKLLERINDFEHTVRGSGGISGIFDLVENPDDPRRINLILDKRLQDEWPFEDSGEYTLDVSFQTKGAFVDLPRRPGHRLKGETDEQREQRIALWLNGENRKAEEEFDQFQMELEDEIFAIIESHGGRIISIIGGPDGTLDDDGIVEFPDSISFRIEMSGKGFRDLILNHPRVFEVLLPDQVEPYSPGNVPADDEPEFELLQPAENAPLVCVIDSGIQEGHKLLQNAVDASRSVCLIPHLGASNVADEVRSGGHGTRVAGVVLYPDSIPSTGAASAKCALGNARVLNAKCKMPPKLYPPRALEFIADHFSECRLFVHSINSRYACRLGHMSTWAAKIDQLSYERDMLFCVSAGNLQGSELPPGMGFLDHLSAGTPHPDYLLSPSSRVSNPAQSLNALVVGSISGDYFDDGLLRSVGQPDHPSAYSRSGMGIWNTVKPDVVEFGGDYCIPTSGLPSSAVIRADTSPELVRSTLFGGHSVSRDAVGTSFATPKVASLAVELATLLPDEPTLLYRALIANSARWPDWTSGLSGPQLLSVFRMIGYGRPDWDRALHNAGHRVTLITSGTAEIKAGEAAIYEVAVPASLRSPEGEVTFRIDVTLSYSCEPRRTRASLKGYQSIWLDWKSSKLRETLDSFRSRMWKDQQAQPNEDKGGPIPWVLAEQDGYGKSRGIRRQGTLVKDWFFAKGFDLPETFAIAVRGHKGWAKKNDDATAKYTLVVSIEALSPEVEVYEEVRNQMEVEIEQRIALTSSDPQLGTWEKGIVDRNEHGPLEEEIDKP